MAPQVVIWVLDAESGGAEELHEIDEDKGEGEAPGAAFDSPDGKQQQRKNIRREAPTYHQSILSCNVF